MKDGTESTSDSDSDGSKESGDDDSSSDSDEDATTSANEASLDMVWDDDVDQSEMIDAVNKVVESKVASDPSNLMLNRGATL